VNRSTRYKQDAVIVVAIIIVILALWRLHSRSNQFGSIGSWASTNIFGPATLSLLSGSEPGGADEQPPATGSNGPVTATHNGPVPIRTNIGTTTSGQSPESTPPGLNQALATNPLNTNRPATIIAVMPSDLETPPGATASSNVPEAATIERRLGEVGAKGGDIQISMSWKNYNDLDLHCIDPGREEIWFSNKRSSRTGGELDVDQNAQMPYNSSPVENIYWPVGGAPRGQYQVYAVYYAQHDGKNATPFTVRAVVRGVTNYFSSTISFSGMRERKLVCTLQY